ncbi:MAG: protein serine/threonine phosphatase [Bacteroidetes bacterium]|nr:protein serine/threonine phosphatase [Bacteroidota bacterium]
MQFKPGRTFSLIFAFCVATIFSFSQQNKNDSLSEFISRSPHSTAKVKALNDLSENYWRAGTLDSAILCANQAKILAEKLNDQKGIAAACNNYGSIYYFQGNFPDAIKNYSLFLNGSRAIGDSSGVAQAYNNLGGIYYDQGNYPEALKIHLRALKIRESLEDQKGIAASHLNIGLVYQDQNDFPKALQNQLAAFKIYTLLKDEKGIAKACNNLGLIYTRSGNYPEAVKNYSASLEIKQKLGDKRGVGICYSNLGYLYNIQKNYSKALDYFTKALTIIEETDDKAHIAMAMNNVGLMYLYLNKAAAGKEYLQKGLKAAFTTGSTDDMKYSYEGLAIADSMAGDYKSALQNYKQFIKCRDSLTSAVNTKKIVESQMQFDFDKKELGQQQEQEKKNVRAGAEKQKQKIILFAVIGGLLLVVFFSLSLYKRFRITRKQKEIIEIKNRETEQQKKIIEEKNKDITDSINYAKRIQQAKLPKKEEIYAALPQSFVLFKPKDIVSGDFYFFHKSENRIVIAAADCTGHGVPGAFMSMIGSERLEDAVSQTLDPSKILSQLNKGIKIALRQSEEEGSTRDGMDIALCVFNTVDQILHYAGANRPLWIIRKGQTLVEEIKATKTAIGGLTPDEQMFDQQEIKLETGDTFYICTDGYADQFSGKHGKKLMTKRFKEMLIEISNTSMTEQEQRLSAFIDEWKAGTEQVDDILVIGVRV